MPAPFDLIALDADDTLWHNESIYRAAHAAFRQLLADHGDPAGHDAARIDQRLVAVEIRNLTHFGYGIKGFILSMIETAVELTEGRVSGAEVQRIIELGREMLAHPVELLDGVRETVEALAGAYRLVLITKGDLLDQETKLVRSGLGELFAAVEIVSEKDARTYRTVMGRHGVAPGRFLMVGNSVRSDVLPVLAAGGHAVHIPYVLTWAHEVVAEHEVEGLAFTRLARIRDLPAWLRARANGAP